MKERHHLAGLGIDTLKWILTMWDGWTQTRLIWLRTMTSGGHLLK